MKPVDSIRRDLATASYLAYSPVPFAGAVHDFSVPMRKRFASREHVGPYCWTPTTPGKGRGFYQSSDGLRCDKAGSTFDLRLELANDHLHGARLSSINGYYCDRNEDQTLTPIIARLPRGRGFLAGWTMGNGMAASIGADIYATAEDAAYAAHSMAGYDAEESRASEDEDSDE